jgi:hypothetical protein
LSENQAAERHTRHGEALSVSPRMGCCLSLVLGTVGVAAALALTGLVAQGEIRFEHSPLTTTRLWLVSQGPNQGLGFSTARALPSLETESRRCVRTTVRFWLWRTDGTAKDVSFCECYQLQGGEWSPNGPCEPQGSNGGHRSPVANARLKPTYEGW